MSNPVHLAVGFLYAGAHIINPPTIGGRMLAPSPDANGDVVYTFTQPTQPCDGPTCEQEILRIDINPDSCWVYQDIKLDNVELVPGFFLKPVLISETLRLSSVGNVNGLIFIFRAHVSSRCAPSS